MLQIEKSDNLNIFHALSSVYCNTDFIPPVLYS